MRRAYAVAVAQQQLSLPTPLAIALVGALAGVAWAPSFASVVIGGAVVVGVSIVSNRRDGTRGLGPVVCLGLVTLALLGLHAVRADAEWHRLADGETGPVLGWVEVVDDPQVFDATTRVTLSVDGQRYDYWVRGRAAQIRARRWEAGNRVRIFGERDPLPADQLRRSAWRHVVGRVEVEWVSDVLPGDRMAVASNRVRATLRRGASQLPDDQAALFRGLVIGDDSDEPPEMIERFRASGMSHLTAVSGQNVAFVLAAAGPLLRRARPWTRWVVTVALIAWFVALTRFEPSIVRAGVMAAISATGYVLGRDRDPRRVLTIAVAALVVIDPLIVTAIGFVLSVGATFGVVAVGPWLTARLVWCGRAAEPIGVTLGAQVGVAVPAMLAFGRLPLVSIPANLLSVPVAGAVMLYGLPAGLVAGVVPPLAPMVMWPCRLGVRWVDSVATVAAAVEPSPTIGVVGWCLIGLVVVSAATHHRVATGRRTGDGVAGL